MSVWHTLMGHHAPPPMGVIADQLRTTLGHLAEADARLYAGLAVELADTPAPQPAKRAAKRALPANEIAAAIALLERHGYTVTPPRG